VTVTTSLWNADLPAIPAVLARLLQGGDELSGEPPLVIPPSILVALASEDQ
jgi:hypothetical protein